jgi:lysine-specific demethylase 8
MSQVVITESKNSESSLPSIDTVEKIEPREFLQKYIRGNKPLLMTGMMGSWPAMQKWSFEFFRDLGARQMVSLEEGNVMQEQTGLRKQSFSDFISQLMTEESDSGRKAYLSVFRIFDAFPELQDDVDFSLLNQFKIKSSSSGWIGPAGTVTGYHIDWGDNILAQISGRKCVHLASPNESPNMYPGKKFDQGTTISQVNMDAYDRNRFPLFENVQHKKLILHPGQMIFIPRGWWHHVRSLDRSISVSNLTFDIAGLFRDALPSRIKQILHDVGLWKCDCTCHVLRDGRRVRK